MLTDVAVKALKPKEKDYKVGDRDGMYVHVTTKGALSFRMDYRLNGRRETLYLGKYGSDGLSLARARESAPTRVGPSQMAFRQLLKSSVRSVGSRRPRVLENLVKNG